jgi:hypothetical protein
MAECRAVLKREDDITCLSSVPNYTMGVYGLQEEIHQKWTTSSGMGQI